MKKLVLVLLSFLTGGFTIAQTSYYKYVNEPNIASSNFFSCLATNSGYVFAGSANNLIFDSHFFIARTNTSGTLQQMRSFPNSGFNSITHVIQTVDGDIAYFGNEGNNTTFINSLVLLKTDIVGNFTINKNYSSATHSLTSRKMFQDAQGNYYLIATANNSQTFQSDLCIIKTDPTGSILAQKIISLGVNCSAMDIIPTAGNGILLTGYASFGASLETIVLVKLDANLALSWSKWFADASLKYFHYDIKEKPNGNFILCGRYDDGTNPYSTLIMELDNSGNQVWAKEYSSNDGTRNHAYSLLITASGNVLVGGGVDIAFGSGPVFAMSVNGTNGNVNWSKFINSGANGELIYEMQQTSSGDIIACGYRDGSASMIKTNGTFDLCSDSTYGITDAGLTIPTQAASATVSNASFTTGTWSLTPTAFTSILDACSGVGIEEPISSGNLSIYPNPVTNQLTINIEKQPDVIKIFDVSGKLVFSTKPGNSENIIINTSKFGTGLYFLQTELNGITESLKFIKSE